MKRLFTLLAVVTTLLTACTAKALSVTNAWARPGNSGGNGAIYFIIDNPTDKADTLLSASCDAAQNVELHISKMNADGTMMMEMQENVPVPAGQKAEFKPGGLHVMLIGLKNELKVGDKLKVTLKFEQAGEITLEAPVKEP